MLEELLSTIFQTKNILENLVKVAVVKTYKPETHTAVVQFKDHDEILSKELPVLTPFTQDNKAYFPLAENQKVIVLFLPVGENTDGFIIGTLFDKDNPPPVKDRNKFHIKFEDGTSFEYDKQNSKLTINVNKDTEININNELKLTSKTKTEEFQQGSLKMTTWQIEGDITLNGNLLVMGNITSTGTTTAQSGLMTNPAGLKLMVDETITIFNTHTHTGDSGGTTSQPNEQITGG